MSGRRRRSNIGRSTVNARRARSARDKESSTEREARLSQRRDRYRVQRARESSVEREARLIRDRDRHRIQRARESSAQTHSNTKQNVQPNSHRSERVTYLWVNKENSAMNYDPSIPYKDDRIVSIGTISVVCEHCLALKFKDESKGMCCLQGKVKLEEILPPPEPLHFLLTGVNMDSENSPIVSEQIKCNTQDGEFENMPIKQETYNNLVIEENNVEMQIKMETENT